MASIQLLLILTCVALSAGAAARDDAEAEMEAEAAGAAEAEAAGAAEIERALTAIQAALGDAREPWSRRLELARDALAPLVAALEAHTATVLLHARRRFHRLQPALEEKLEAACDLLARTQEELVAGATERGAAALAEVAAAVARAREHLAALAPPTEPDSAGTHADH